MYTIARGNNVVSDFGVSGEFFRKRYGYFFFVFNNLDGAMVRQVHHNIGRKMEVPFEGVRALAAEEVGDFKRGFFLVE